MKNDLEVYAEPGCVGCVTLLAQAEKMREALSLIRDFVSPFGDPVDDKAIMQNLAREALEERKAGE